MKNNPFNHIANHLVLEIFKLNGELISFGDNVVAPIGLTSARWQILGTIAKNERPLSVPQIARAMNLSRQAVQRVINDMLELKLIETSDNPDHKLAKLICMSELGKSKFQQATDLWQPIADGIKDSFAEDELINLIDKITELRFKLEIKRSKEPQLK